MTRSPTDRTLLLRLLRWARPYAPRITGILLLGLLSTPLTLLAPVPLKLAVDSYLGSEPLPALLGRFLPAADHPHDTAVLAVAVGLLLLVALLSQLQALASSVLSTGTAERLVLEFRARLFLHLQRLSLSYHETRGTADSVYRIQHDAASVQYLLLDGLIPLVSAAFSLVGMIWVTFRLDAQLAFVAIAISPPLFLVARAYRTRVRSQSHRLKRLESDTLSVVQEVLVGMRIVKAFGQEEREQRRFVTHSRDTLQAKVRLQLVEGSLGLLLGVTVAAGTAAVLFVGARSVAAGSLTLGELLLIMAYLAQLYRPLNTMSRKTASVQRHLASVERMFAVLDRVPEVVERPDARPLARAEGHVRFEGVDFTYGDGTVVLRDVTIDVPSGTRVGLVGETGVGKTTLVTLLSRFHDPTAGRITLDGVDLRDYRLADLRAQFAIVPQEAMLFSTTIRENISYGDPHADEEAIVRAAKAVRAHDFISRLPDGYETKVGERGLRLSGGERQRIALARALLKDARIVILDEPTSAIDAATETGILEAMDVLMRGRTCFLVTHRERTLEVCDEVLRVDRSGITTVTPTPRRKTG